MRLCANNVILKSKTIIVLAGPTAVGKTSLAIDIARHFNTEIISADSRQCYKELNIGVAKPSPEQLQAVRHHFINSHSIHDDVNAATFENYALEKSEEIFAHNPVAVMVGGTGLYIKAFCEGLDEIPPVPDEIRANIIQQYDVLGLPWLQQEIQSKDPLYFSTGEILNPQRLMRALEVKLSTGKSIRDYQSNKTVTRNFNVIKIGLDLPRQSLHPNINHRVDEMIKDGLEDEARELYKYRDLPALRTVGYTEFFEYFDGKSNFDETVELIKKNTRQYAKRQLTWFRKDKSYTWFSPLDKEALLNHFQLLS